MKFESEPWRKRDILAASAGVATVTASVPILLGFGTVGISAGSYAAAA